MTTQHPLITPQWFVAYTHSRAERKVHTEFVSLGIYAILPLREIRRRAEGHTHYFDVPLFSNYVFVQTAVSRLATLSRIQGVAYFVSFGGKPASISDEEANAIQKSCYRYLYGDVGKRTVLVHNNVAGNTIPEEKNQTGNNEHRLIA